MIQFFSSKKFLILACAIIINLEIFSGLDFFQSLSSTEFLRKIQKDIPALKQYPANLLEEAFLLAKQSLFIGACFFWLLNLTMIIFTLKGKKTSLYYITTLSCLYFIWGLLSLMQFSWFGLIEVFVYGAIFYGLVVHLKTKNHSLPVRDFKIEEQ